MRFTVLSTACLLPTVFGHGKLVQPKADVSDDGYATRITASIDPGFEGRKYNNDPTSNVKAFTEAFKSQKTFKTLKDMVEKQLNGSCGKSSGKGKPQSVEGLSDVHWENTEEKTGFVSSHSGPCEIWIDDTRVMHEDNCVAKFKGYPAKMPVNYSVCKGECMLRFYWLALHEPEWQVYKNCVPIVNKGGKGPSSGACTGNSTSCASGGATQLKGSKDHEKKNKKQKREQKKKRKNEKKKKKEKNKKKV